MKEDPIEHLDDEIHDHIERETEDNIARGLAPAEARRQARLRFGNLALTREDARAVWAWVWLEQLWQDVRYAARGFENSPRVAAIVIVSLALGIGANVAIFSLVNAIVLRPLPYSTADRLVQILQYSGAPDGGNTAALQEVGLDGEELTVFRATNRSLTEVGSYTATISALTHGAETIRIPGTRISPSFFSILGAKPFVGRTFESREEERGNESVLVLSFKAWQRYFGGSSGILDEDVLLDGAQYRIVGVMDSGFQFPDAGTEFWTPLVVTPTPGLTAKHPVYGLLRPGMSLETASADVNASLQKLANPLLIPSSRPAALMYSLARLQDRIAGPVIPTVRILMFAAWGVFLVACVNVANLLLARGAAREPEMGLRQALGAGRGRLLRQILVENVIFALAGGTAGLVVAVATMRGFRLLASGVARPDVGPALVIPRLGEVGVDTRVLVYALGVSLLSGVLCAVVLAFHQLRGERFGGHRVTLQRWAMGKRRWQGVLLGTEIVVVMVLVISEGLLLRSFVKLSRVDPGFDPTNVLTFQVAPSSPSRSLDGEVGKFSNSLVKRIMVIPGVLHVGYGNPLPMLRLEAGTFLRKQSNPPVATEPVFTDTLTTPRVVSIVSSAGFLEAIGLRLIRGAFLGADRRPPAGLLVNKTLASNGFLGPEPIGVQLYAGRTLVQVVGVVDDIHMRDLTAPFDLQVFMEYQPEGPGPGLQPWSGLGPYFAVRTDRAPLSFVSTIRGLVRQLDPSGAIDHIATLEQLISESLFRPRLYAR
ncbi:MAG TPA: ABC transporter permease, partial [Vicinamibacterales bacterium]